MNLNSPLFDSIRIKPEPRQTQRAGAIRCEAAGCEASGDYRAPMGRQCEGRYFCFCLDHVREYNNSYNYFSGMNDADVARFVKDAATGHRPTWSMGTRRGAGAFREDGGDDFADPLGLYRSRFHRGPARGESPSRHSIAAAKALDALGLDESASAETIKARYKDLVKRHHPDVNGGDRSREDKLREVINAYRTLRSARLV